MFKLLKFSVASICLLICNSVLADISIPMYLISQQGLGQSIGTVIASEKPYGVLLTPNLHNLPPGLHGFHIHQNPSCLDNGMAAGDHFDPFHSSKHLGPYGKGHLGDLPVLDVDNNGNATLPILAPRLRLNELKNHSLIIHADSDNYSDIPTKLGGGGARIACGIIK
ncbi:superoxide dismutase [Candidatus Rickettsiella isopodorum]|jgi:Cu-Zn family superoxide dismutase|uniref:Superoxide dismutase [Cu-Zn] n=1 Tax=Candidatus Rickettsiella isopodorum TaxID=1225476 RepID=A0A1J8NKA8_9COXI|nr:superoxide dismutase family protein [Candidatus Rickettsiella isopodorum]OIZ94470.1 superoxide dismutase [Candidatus Rickettsiella isopodorum]